MRLIDGEKLIADYEREKAFNETIGNTQRAWDITTFIADLESDNYLIPSNQGEARLREAFEELRRMEFDQYGHSTYVSEFIDQALSSHTEIAAITQEVGNWIDERCPKCGAQMIGISSGKKWCSYVLCDYVVTIPGITDGGKADE